MPRGGARIPGLRMRSLFTRAKKPDYALSVSPGGGDPPQEAYVEVRLADGRGWAARLHTPESVRGILDDWHHRGELRGERSGLYFWAPDVVVVREISQEAIVALVEDLLAEGELEMAFAPIEHGTSTP